MARHRSKFNRRSTAEQVTAGLDLSGKTALVTGVNSGLGEETMRVLCARGAHVIGAARSLQKAEQACANVAGSTTPLACELSDFADVVQASDSVHKLGMPLDMLICNAGIMAPKQFRQAHGLELQFATNHMGHFILVNRLLPLVQAAEQGRIVMLSSLAHTQSVKGGINFANLSGEKGYHPWQFYGQSKLANLLTARYLAKQLRDTPVTVNAVHPGIIRTNLGRDVGFNPFSIAIMALAPLLERSVAQGAATQCYVATHPALASVSGEYFADCQTARTSSAGRNETLAEQLWQESCRLAADYL